MQWHAIHSIYVHKCYIASRVESSEVKERFCEESNYMGENQEFKHAKNVMKIPLVQTCGQLYIYRIVRLKLCRTELCHECILE